MPDAGCQTFLHQLWAHLPPERAIAIKQRLLLLVAFKSGAQFPNGSAPGTQFFMHYREEAGSQ
jgi:hypothetical protein